MSDGFQKLAEFTDAAKKFHASMDKVRAKMKDLDEKEQLRTKAAHLERSNKELREALEVERNRRQDEYRDRATGKAINRACIELPEGFDLHIELEKDAGTVSLYRPDGEEVDEEFHGDYFHHAIDNAINVAIALSAADANKGKENG